LGLGRLPGGSTLRLVRGDCGLTGDIEFDGDFKNLRDLFVGDRYLAGDLDGDFEYPRDRFRGDFDLA